MKMRLLGEVMREHRERLGLTQEQVCEGICDPATLSRIENGRLTPSHNRMKALLQRLGMPDDRYYALLSEHELELNHARKEMLARISRFEEAGTEQKKQAWTAAMEQVHRLEELTEDDDHISRQFILSHRATLGPEDGPYLWEERLDMLLTALRLTAPKFDLEKMDRHRYSMDEIRLINQIANTYSNAGEHAKALHLYKLLYDYVRDNNRSLSNYESHFTLVAYNYARELCMCEYYHEGIEVAEEGKRVGLDYGCYEFLPGFLALLGETYYLLGEEEKSKKLWVQAHYLYEVMEDERGLRIVDPDIKARFQLEFPI